MGYNAVADDTGRSSFVVTNDSAVVSFQICEILRKLNLTVQCYRPWGQSKAHMQLPISH